MKKETNSLKKLDQMQNLDSIKQQHKDHMLRIQAKHFSFDA